MTSQPAVFPPPTFVDLPGLRIAYREWGRADAVRTVVLIHGITSSSLSWVRVGPTLGRRSRAIAMDLKGHGDSGQTPTGYRIEDQAGEVAALCAALGLRSAAVIGHSWGGAVALHLAATTDLVERLVLEDPATGPRDQDSPIRAQIVEGYATSVGLDRDEAERRARENLALGWTEDDVAGKVDASVKGSPAAVRAVFQENRPWNLRELLPRLTCPTLLLLAAEERGGIVDEPARALAQANPQIRTVLVPEADHNIHRTRYNDCMALVEPFLAGAPA